MNMQTASAIFDTQAEAQRAVADLRDAGVPDRALSVVTQHGGTISFDSQPGSTTFTLQLPINNAESGKS